MVTDVTLETFDFAAFVRSGDFITWGQASAEPTGLVSALMSRRSEIGDFTAFVGMTWSNAIAPEHADRVRFISYCGTGTNRLLGRAGVLDVIPLPYSQIASYLIPRVDVLMLRVSPEDEHGRFGFGAAYEYLVPLVEAARLVIVEVDETLPRLSGERDLGRDDIDVIVRSPSLRPTSSFTLGSEVEATIARFVAERIEDGATLQVGIGTLPETVLAALRDHRDLGLHSGLISDGVADLVSAGVVTNARKSIDCGLSVAGLAGGGKRLFDLLRHDRTFHFRSTAYTHAPGVLASIERFTAINSAVEVDLTGQVNAEVAGGRYVGAIGGGAEFLRGASVAPRGLPIVALPATAGTGEVRQSRIVAQLSGPVSTARADVGVIVTEYGLVDLRGLTLAERRHKMIEIAAPEFREELARATHVLSP